MKNFFLKICLNYMHEYDSKTFLSIYYNDINVRTYYEGEIALN